MTLVYSGILMYSQYERQLKDEIQKFQEIDKPQKGFGFTLLF